MPAGKWPALLGNVVVLEARHTAAVVQRAMQAVLVAATPGRKPAACEKRCKTGVSQVQNRV